MLKRDISATFLGNAAYVGLSFFSAIIVSRWLGVDGRGMFALALLVPSIVSAFATFGQESANVALAGMNKDKRGVLFAQSLVATVIGAVIGVLAILTFFYWLPIPRGNFDRLGDELIWASCLFPPASIFSGLSLALVRGCGRVVLAAALRVVTVVTVVLLLVVFVVILGYGVKAAVITTAAALIPAPVIGLWLIRREIRTSGIRLEKAFLVQSLKFGLPICLAGLASYLVYRLPQGILGYTVSEVEVGLYVTAVSLAEQLKVLPDSISTAFLPRLANELDSRRQQVPLVFRLTLIVSMAAMAIAGVLGIPVILFMFGWEFAGSIVPFLILLPGVAALGGASILASDILTRQKTSCNFIVGYATLALSIGGNLALIPLLGISGSAIAATVSYFFALGLWAHFYRRESGTPARQLLPTWADVRMVAAMSGQMAGKVLARIRR